MSQNLETFGHQAGSVLKMSRFVVLHVWSGLGEGSNMGYRKMNYWLVLDSLRMFTVRFVCISSTCLDSFTPSRLHIIFVCFSRLGAVPLGIVVVSNASADHKQLWQPAANSLSCAKVLRWDTRAELGAVMNQKMYCKGPSICSACSSKLLD